MHDLPSSSCIPGASSVYCPKCSDRSYFGFVIVNGKHYIDGGLVDNVPLGALVKQSCTHAIAIHLENGLTWNRHDFSQQTVIKIRPELPMTKFDIPIFGDIATLLNFDSNRIAELKQKCYEDAKRCVAPMIDIFKTVADYRKQQSSLVKSTQALL